MAEYEEDEDDDQLPSVDHGPLNEGPWEKELKRPIMPRIIKLVNYKDQDSSQIMK